MKVLACFFRSALTARNNLSYFFLPSIDHPLPPPFVVLPLSREYVYMGNWNNATLLINSHKNQITHCDCKHLLAWRFPVLQSMNRFAYIGVSADAIQAQLHYVPLVAYISEFPFHFCHPPCACIDEHQDQKCFVTDGQNILGRRYHSCDSCLHHYSTLDATQCMARTCRG